MRRAFEQRLTQAMRANSRSAALLIRARGESGFDQLVSAPFFAPGAGGDLFLTADHERAHPIIDALLPADEIVEEFADACRAHGLKPSLDVILERIDADAAIVRSRPDWFHAADTAARVDPRSSRQGADAAYARFDQRAIAKEIAGWLIERLLRLLRDLIRKTSFTWRGKLQRMRLDPATIPFAIWRLAPRAGRLT